MIHGERHEQFAQYPSVRNDADLLVAVSNERPLISGKLEFDLAEHWARAFTGYEKIRSSAQLRHKFEQLSVPSFSVPPRPGRLQGEYGKPDGAGSGRNPELKGLETVHGQDATTCEVINRFFGAQP